MTELETCKTWLRYLQAYYTFRHSLERHLAQLGRAHAERRPRDEIVKIDQLVAVDMTAIEKLEQILEIARTSMGGSI